ncbi:MAG: M6 family metalloprotease domain-containing protein [Candidatus Syntrophosphaera sp.]|nr:M6 family metalloprotease domain-containing protein [Candidatus Syntrophosphaera sp.]
MKQFWMTLLFLPPLFLCAANFINLPTAVEQPDGSVLALLASGDEFANRLHDAEGFSIMQSSADGYYYYAVLAGGEPVPSAWRVDAHDPRALGLVPGINISPAAYQAKVDFMTSHARSGSRGPNLGTVNNLVVYIKFSDQTEFEVSRGEYDAKFNSVGADEYSLRNYFHQVSYDQLDYVSHHYPVCAPEVNLSYTDSHPRAYYMPYNAVTNPQGYRDYQRTDREHILLANALNAISSQVPASLNIDADNDGFVDNVCFIIRGPHTAWAELLWAHRWALYAQDVYINGKMVWDFTFQPENQNSVRTLCHEMFHSVGAPDLYHYNFDGLTPAGCWDIMESGNGHMGMHMKARYGGWISPIPTISEGFHTLSPVTSATNNAYRVPLSGTEYLVLEYRKQDSDIFEAGLPGSGLLIHRINEAQNGNAQGPPDEVYVFRPQGGPANNGLIAQAAFSLDSSRTEFNQFSDPNCFLGSGNPIPVNIHSISEAGGTISFILGQSSGPLPPQIGNLSPADGEILTPGEHQISAEITAPGDVIVSVEFSLDGMILGLLYSSPYVLDIPDGFLTPGHHEIKVRATTGSGLSSVRQARVRMVDPQQPTWFNWLSDAPVHSEFGRGAVPIKAAVDFNLGAEDFNLKKVAFMLSADPWGFPAVPGLVNIKVNRFAEGAITSQTLLDIGDVMCDLGQWFELDVDSDVVLNGQIAVILDLFEYQIIHFDTNGVCGHSWLTEPDRPWTDALGRGVVGAAVIEVQLQSPYVSNPEDTVPAAISGLKQYPNPFSAKTTLSFELRSAQPVRISIYNLRGQKVAELIDSNLPAGSHSLEWDGRNRSGREAGAGIYLCRLKAGAETFYRRMAIVK